VESSSAQPNPGFLPTAGAFCSRGRDHSALETIRKLEIELTTIQKQIHANEEEHSWLLEWKKEIEGLLNQEIRRRELPETRAKTVDD
jgi:hypothetical protein